MLEYLNYITSRLPKGAVASLGPDATGVGWVYEYALVSDHHSLGELRAVQDWYIRYQLTTVPGVAEVASVGGHVMRRLTARAKAPGFGSVGFVERRPWERGTEPLTSYRFSYAISEVGQRGLLKERRERLIGGAG